MQTPHILRRRKAIGNRLMSPKVKRRIKKGLIETDPRCRYCDALVTVDTAILDHFYPVLTYPGLAGDPDNLVLSCRSCDRFKADVDPNFYGSAEAFMHYMSTMSPSAKYQKKQAHATREQYRLAESRLAT